MTTAEKIFGAVAAVIVGGLVTIIVYCVFWMQGQIQVRDKIICKQDSVIVVHAQKIDSLINLVRKK